MKICKKCKISKELDQFYKHRRYKNGYLLTCIECTLGRTPKYRVRIDKSKKICVQCKQDKPVNLFYLDKRTNQYPSKCRKCVNKNRQEKRKLQPLKEKQRQRKKELCANYGLTYDAFLQMINNQNNKCKICNLEMIKPCVDHCHTTGKVRGLLCQKCNSGIGLLGDNIENLQSAIEYLQENQLEPITEKIPQ